ncbi:cryptochrome-1-like [Argiope bruennichi]|uniref:cryptochrome-1-like n=1 Tax=Argiope bruennichi TaxID=94029 RepID=UPI0024957D76|nr:cryptochrome-1-like [Argiope bruennichi]XP_055950029.1 cryptochrome-1-like [Argiope bruennichi]
MSGAKFIHWFRMDLRLHDVPTITTALKSCSSFYPVYIFDEDDIKEQKIRYNKVRFIIDALNDINNKLQLNGGRLYVFKGNPAKIFSDLFKKWDISYLSYEEDVQPIWKETEKSIQEVCEENNVKIIKEVSHTLWNLDEILNANRGQPPVTYEVFCHVVDAVGPPPKPEPDLNLDGVLMPRDDSTLQDLPNEPEDLGVYPECIQQKNKIWVGGEVRALEHLRERLKVEEAALADGFFMPNQAQPDLLGPSMSLSAALSLGCLSVRKLYWSLQDLHSSINPDLCVSESLINQLLWREYFYAMCKNNPNYGTMRENPICLNIPWLTDDQKLKSWTNGQTGFPFIDAAMRQMIQEGWVHHVGRNAVACFLTRVDLWISWEEGFKIFMKYLIDADFPVCAGNWMWVSSSAFENILQCPTCISPISYGRCVEPSGNYIRKYVPELRNMPAKYIFEPWLAPLSVQEQAGCIIGTDYPYPIVNHQEAAKINRKRMDSIKAGFYQKPFPLHCAPSNAMETRVFMWLPEKCIENLKSN